VHKHVPDRSQVAHSVVDDGDHLDFPLFPVPPGRQEEPPVAQGMG
jgi:hypothetical protein